MDYELFFRKLMNLISESTDTNDTVICQIDEVCSTLRSVSSELYSDCSLSDAVEMIDTAQSEVSDALLSLNEVLSTLRGN